MIVESQASCEDLRDYLKFSIDEGLIWLDQSRMVLMHVTALAELRQELIATLGVKQARRIFTRIGFISGENDAELARKKCASLSLAEAFAIGPKLHMLEGGVKAQLTKLKIDDKTGHFYGEITWQHSWEAETYIQQYGETKDSVCWMMLGYASGYTSSFFKSFIIFQEESCAASGCEYCHIIGQPLDDWPNAHELAFYYEAFKADHDYRYWQDMQQESPSVMACRELALKELTGGAAGIQDAYDFLSKAAATDVTVLLLGETGVGKERFARALHELSNRKNQPFVTVNCAALPTNLIESELFGVEKGAYTGAIASRAGKFERANNGTLFLDEIGELPLDAQAKLLRVLQEKEVERIGDNKTKKINVRLIAATNIDLEKAVENGSFRSDLFYRLNVYPILIPPLRERITDLPLLTEQILKQIATKHNKEVGKVSNKAMHILKNYHWPGNIRQLENVLERAVILVEPQQNIDEEHLAIQLPAIEQVNLNQAGVLNKQQVTIEQLLQKLLAEGVSLPDLEETILQKAVSLAKGNLAEAARMLGITRPQLSYRLKKQ